MARQGSLARWAICRAISGGLLTRLRRDTLVAMLDRITFDPRVMGGRACLRGMRITVAQVVNLVANGMSVAEIVAEYPDLEAEDVAQALKYVAMLANEEIRPLGPPSV
jgi:uncharacterized protein (DUF433 family)